MGLYVMFLGGVVVDMGIERGGGGGMGWSVVFVGFWNKIVRFEFGEFVVLVREYVMGGMLGEVGCLNCGKCFSEWWWVSVMGLYFFFVNVL